MLEKPTERNNEDTKITVCFEKMLLKFLNTIHVLSSAHRKDLRVSSSFKPFHQIYSFYLVWILFIIKISKISPSMNAIKLFKTYTPMLMQLQHLLNYEFIKIQTQNEALVIYKQETFRKILSSYPLWQLWLNSKML